MKIEDELIETLGMAAQLEVAPGNLRALSGNEEGKLNYMTAMLQDKLVQRLGGPLGALDRVQFENNLGILRGVRADYEKIIKDMKSVVGELKDKLAQSQ